MTEKGIQMFMSAIRWSQCWLLLCYLIVCIILTNHIRFFISQVTGVGCLGLISYCLTRNVWGSVRIWQTILVLDISRSSYSTFCCAHCQVILHHIFFAPWFWQCSKTQLGWLRVIRPFSLSHTGISRANVCSGKEETIRSYISGLGCWQPVWFLVIII